MWVPLLVVSLLSSKSSLASAGHHRKLFPVTDGEPIPGQFIVELRDDVENVKSVTDMLLQFDEVEIIETYEDVFKGFAVKGLTDDLIDSLLALEQVTVVSEDGVVNAVANQNKAPWNLDTLDANPGDRKYTYSHTGAGVDVYILDTGIFSGHSEFEGRVASCYDKSGEGCGDRNGHGTHVAGIVGAKTYGVAKKVRLHDFKVLNRSGSGSYSNVIAGINEIARIRKRSGSAKKMVANLSLSGGYNRGLNDAINGAVKAGVVVVAAAGNNNGQNACSFSPGSSNAIVVGSLDRNGRVSDFSNKGSCVDSWAPGRDIVSVGNSNGRTAVYKGTSMSAPHVAGAAALYLEVGEQISKLGNGRALNLSSLSPPPTPSPTPRPTQKPTPRPSLRPSRRPTHQPTQTPSTAPTNSPSRVPTYSPLQSDVSDTTARPTFHPSSDPTFGPTLNPTRKPTESPSNKPVAPPAQCITMGKTCKAGVDSCCGPTVCRGAWNWHVGYYETCRSNRWW